MKNKITTTLLLNYFRASVLLLVLIPVFTGSSYSDSTQVAAVPALIAAPLNEPPEIDSIGDSIRNALLMDRRRDQKILAKRERNFAELNRVVNSPKDTIICIDNKPVRKKGLFRRLFNLK